MLLEALKKLQDDTFAHRVRIPVLELEQIRVDVAQRDLNELPSHCEILFICKSIPILVSLTELIDVA